MSPNPTSDAGSLSAADVKRLAREVGFDLCGVADVQIPSAWLECYRDWLARGSHAGMRYLDRYLEVRADPRILMPDARAIVCCALSYHVSKPSSLKADGRGRAWISRYAWGDDYHDVMRRMLKELGRRIREACAPSAFRARACVDTAPIFERSLAARAGLGQIGRNGSLITRQFGSYVFLGELLVNLDLDCDDVAPAPPGEMCGQCRACVDACPGHAIGDNGLVDARRCASYLTIEHRGAFDSDSGAAIGRNVFGCDVCQDVCPWNARAATPDRSSFQPRPGAFSPTFESLEALDEATFKTRFEGSPVIRCRLEGLRRNLAQARANALLGEASGKAQA